MNNKGQLAGHLIWAFVALIILAVVTYIFTLNRPDVQKGGFQADYHRQDWPLSVHIGEGGCARLDSLKGDKNAISNTQVKH
jgi:hypothetical protein